MIDRWDRGEKSIMQLISQEYIEVSSDVRSGKPRIAGTRIAIEDVAEMHLRLAHILHQSQ
ncbi:MAG: DUF433 domain-containing protein [Phormidesmis sp. CAN_BIN44]|nr:DUF433 domain-containing protein [Phormidesmis sp. CAN_BIN44]